MCCTSSNELLKEEGKMMRWMRDLWKDESGVGVVEMILICGANRIGSDI